MKRILTAAAVAVACLATPVALVAAAASPAAASTQAYVHT